VVAPQSSIRQALNALSDYEIIALVWGAEFAWQMIKNQEPYNDLKTALVKLGKLK
jgi:hypothetical protein